MSPIVSPILPLPRLAPPPLLAELRALPRSFWVLFAGTFINRFGTFVWPFLTIYLVRSGFSPQIAGVTIACFGVGSIGGSTLGGWLADRLGRRHTIVVGAFASSAFYLLLYCASTLPFIMLSAGLAGLAGGTYNPASSALLADIVPEERRVRAYSAVRLALNAGFGAGSACAGFLAAHGSSFWLFAGDALSTAIFAIIAWTALPHGIRAAKQHAPWSVALRSLRANRAFHALFFGMLCLGLITTQWVTTYPIHVLRAVPFLDLFQWRLHDTQIYGLLLAWNGLMVVLVELPLTGFILRFEARQVMAVGYLLQGFGFALTGCCFTFPTLWAAMTLFTLGEIAVAPVASAYLARVAPEQMRGRYMGVLALAWSTSGILGPIFGPRLLAFSPALLWSACAALGLFGAASILLGSAAPEFPASGGSSTLPDAG